MPAYKDEKTGKWYVAFYFTNWKLLIDKKMNKTQLKNAAQVSGATIAKLGKEEPISHGIHTENLQGFGM